MSKLDMIVTGIFLLSMILFLINILYKKDGDEKVGDEKDTTEKSRNLWSIILTVLIAIPALVYELLREIFWRRRRY